MSQTLTVQISDQAYAAIRAQAETTGVSDVKVAADALERQFRNGDGTVTDEERQAARERFERHFGEVNLGSPTGTDNECIDADLARAYADNHETN
jgi:hypothetical protein